MYTAEFALPSFEPNSAIQEAWEISRISLQNYKLSRGLMN
jgi:hypothetical protein